MRAEFVQAIERAGTDEESWVVLGHWVDMSIPPWGGVYPFCSVTDGVWFWPWTYKTLAQGWSVAGFVWIDFSSPQPIELTVEFGEATCVSVVFGGGGMAPAKLASRWLPDRGWGRLDYAVRWVLPDPKHDVDV
jgi:hypothetical protein